jgi:hypothetical protein
MAERLRLDATDLQLLPIERLAPENPLRIMNKAGFEEGLKQARTIVDLANYLGHAMRKVVLEIGGELTAVASYGDFVLQEDGRGEIHFLPTHTIGKIVRETQENLAFDGNGKDGPHYYGDAHQGQVFFVQGAE